MEEITEVINNDEQDEDNLWQAKTGLNEDTLCGAVETVIFMSDRPVSLAKIKNLIDEDLPLRVLHQSLEKLQAGYETLQHGIRLVEVAEGYQFRTKAVFSKYVQDLFKVNSLVLTPTSLETLAIIAYKRPISRGKVDEIRGVDSSHIIRGLMDKRLVKIIGRSEEMGRPVLYGPTQEFLEVFNLADISQLPPEHELETMIDDGIGKISDIKSFGVDGDKKSFFFDEIDELDRLSSNIKSIVSDTTFTKSLRVEENKRINEDGHVQKTAFDLLEEHITGETVSDQNRISSDSELLLDGIFPSVISDLQAGPFNLPEIDEEFEMIDLDTGEVVSNDQNKEKDIQDDSDQLSLSDALDNAFAKLISDTPAPEITDEENSELDEKDQSIDELTKQIVSEGEKLDMDLSFLQ